VQGADSGCSNRGPGRGMSGIGMTVEPTKDRLYESKDSREIEKCSISPTSLRVSVELRDRYLRGHDASFSVGEGWGFVSATRPCN
jgi:hypothetical protein